MIHDDVMIYTRGVEDLLLLARHARGELGVPDGHVVAHGDQLEDGVLLSTVGNGVQRKRVHHTLAGGSLSGSRTPPPFTEHQ